MISITDEGVTLDITMIDGRVALTIDSDDLDLDVKFAPSEAVQMATALLRALAVERGDEVAADAKAVLMSPSEVASLERRWSEVAETMRELTASIPADVLEDTKRRYETGEAGTLTT